MLDVAEQIGTLIEAGVWTATTFPISEELERRLHAGQATVHGALQVNVARGQVQRCTDPDSARRRLRYLPCPPGRSALPASGAEWVAAVVAERIADGRWTVDNFPSTREIAAELHCGHDTVDSGLGLAAGRGVIRKVRVLARPPGRGRKWVWRPASAAAGPQLSAYERLAADIRAGVLSGQLPFIRQMSRELRVNQQEVTDAYRRLSEEGLIHRVHLRPGSRRHQWHVVDGSEPLRTSFTAPTSDPDTQA